MNSGANLIGATLATLHCLGNETDTPLFGRRLTECGLVPAVLGHISQITKSLSAAKGAEPNVKEMTILEPLSKIVNKVAKEERSAFLEVWYGIPEETDVIFHRQAHSFASILTPTYLPNVAYGRLRENLFACRKDICCYESGRKLDGTGVF